MKVWVAYYSDYDDGSAVVFSTREKAEAYAAKMPRKDFWQVREYTVNSNEWLP